MKKRRLMGVLIGVLCLSVFFTPGVMAADKQPLRVAVAAMISPKSTLIYYKRLIEYVGQKVGRPALLKQRPTYAAVNEMLRKHEVDFGFICAGPYVKGHKEFGLQLVAAPVAYGDTVYYSYVIVNKKSPYSSFEELRGKKYAFTDPNSNSGCLVPTYQIALKGSRPEAYFGKLIYSRSHDNSIRSVAAGIVDGASVDHLIYEYTAATDPQYTNKTKVVEKFGPFGIPPVVAPEETDPIFLGRLREVFLHMHEDTAGKRILEKIHIDRFALVDDADYDSVRKMEEWLDARP